MAEMPSSTRQTDLDIGVALQRLRFESVPCFEDPPHYRHAYGQEDRCHGQAHADTHIGDLIETPAKPAYQIDNRIEKSDGLPKRRQHIDRVKTTAKEDQWRNDEKRHELQPLETVGPDAENKAEEAEGHSCKYEEREHP